MVVTPVKWDFEKAGNWPEYKRYIEKTLSGFQPDVRHLARVLFSVSHFGDLDHIDETPAPLHIDLAIAIATSEDMRRAILSAINDLDLT